MKHENWINDNINHTVLSNSQAEEIETFMVNHNLRLNKKDVTRAAKELRISVKSALVYFQNIKNELLKDKILSNKRLLKQIRKIYKRIKNIEKLNII